MTKVIVLIPAHNEEERIVDAILSAKNQSRKPDQIVVMSDNSTDATVQIAQNMGVDVVESIGNDKKKAGALNQVFLGYLKHEDDETYVLIQDADTELSPNFVEAALKAMEDRTVGAVGGIFLGDGKNGLLGDCQNLEYVRYAREIGRAKGEAKVLTGTSTFTRVGILREVKNQRVAGKLPQSARDGDVYNTYALTEDFELTLCIKKLG